MAWRLPFDGTLQKYIDGQQFGVTGFDRDGRGHYFHDGYDFGSNQYPHTIRAVTDATVKYIGMPGYGLGAVIVLNNGEYDIMYQEFAQSTSGITVSVGQHVTIGQAMATLTGTHLHLGITKMDWQQALAHAYTNDGTWLDPIKVIQSSPAAPADSSDTDKTKDDTQQPVSDEVWCRSLINQMMMNPIYDKWFH